MNERVCTYTQALQEKRSTLTYIFVDLSPYMSLYIVLIENNGFYNLCVGNHDIYVNKNGENHLSLS